MPSVVGVSFKPVTKVYYFDPTDVPDLQAGDYVVVETARGREIGQVVWQPKDVTDAEVGGALKPVVRRATALDLVERDRHKNRQREALTTCRAKVAEMSLPMKVVGAEYSYDGRRLTVSFTADGRVDFRDLVRDLARSLRTRIEMKQIGARDEAKVLDGVGKCGRQLCCSGWLRDFNPVSIKMAKQQNLPLNPVEISGVCGRLLCCLAYEMETYNEIRKQLPKVGAAVMTPAGPGKVRKVHALRQRLTVRLNEDQTLEEFGAEELEYEAVKGRGRSCGCAASSATDTADKPDSADQQADQGSQPSRRSSSRRPRRRSDDRS